MFNFTAEYYGKRFDFTATTNPENYALGLGISYTGVYLDLIFFRFTYRFEKVASEGWV